MVNEHYILLAFILLFVSALFWIFELVERAKHVQQKIKINEKLHFITLYFNQRGKKSFRDGVVDIMTV